MYFAFDKQLKEIGHASLSFAFVSKYFIFLDCNLPSDRVREVNYNKISHLGSPKGDRVRLIKRGDRLKEVKLTVNMGRKFREFEK